MPDAVEGSDPDNAVLVKPAVAPTASEQYLGQYPDDRNLDRFRLALELPADPERAAALRQAIDRVTYKFNHPSFQNKTSAGQGPEYATQYEGDGSLRSVLVTIALKSGKSVTLDFAMGACLHTHRGQAPEKGTSDPGKAPPAPTKGEPTAPEKPKN